MEDFGAIEELSGGELLDLVGVLGAEQRRTECRILQAALQHAVLNDASSVDPVAARLPGRERAVRLGGVGTPRVAEFAAASFGARLGVSTYAGRALLADALDLAHRLPRLWARVGALEVPTRYARLVARQTRDLDSAQADLVDERVAEYADGRLSWSRFEALVDAAVTASDPEAAAAAEAEAAAAQCARPTRTDRHGMRGFFIRADAATVAVLDAAVARIAQILADLGDADPVEVRRVKALLVLARPDRAAELLAAYQQWGDRPADPEEAGTVEAEGHGDKPALDWAQLLPTVVLYVHLAASPHPSAQSDSSVARVEGVGPVTAAWVRRVLGDRARFTIRPVLDLAGIAPVDAYEVPERHRQAVHLMTPADIFPFSSSTSRSVQIDHTEPFRHGRAARGAGQSRLGNYGPMTTTHHRIKTFGGWEVKQPFPGLYLWRDPHGQAYLVDHTGTRPLTKQPARPRPATRAELAFTEVTLRYAA